MSTTESRIEPDDIARDVDRFVAAEFEDDAKYDNRSPLDESGVFSLHRLAARIYAAGYNQGERTAMARHAGERQREFDRKRATQ